MTVGPQRAVTLLSAGGFPLSPVLSVFGTVTSGPTLPGGCVLQNDAASALLLVTDGFGYAAQSFMLPATAVGTIYQQFVSIDPTTFAFRASNGLEIACTP